MAVEGAGVRAHISANGECLRRLLGHKVAYTHRKLMCLTYSRLHAGFCIKVSMTQIDPCLTQEATRCLACAPDGSAFATGGTDHRVLIWTAEGETTHVYSHTDAVTCLGYDHNSSHLASASASEIMIWSPKTRSAAKHKVEHLLKYFDHGRKGATNSVQKLALVTVTMNMVTKKDSNISLMWYRSTQECCICVGAGPAALWPWGRRMVASACETVQGQRSCKLLRRGPSLGLHGSAPGHSQMTYNASHLHVDLRSCTEQVWSPGNAEVHVQCRDSEEEVMVVLSRKGHLSSYDAFGRPAGPGVTLDRGASALGCFDSGAA